MGTLRRWWDASFSHKRMVRTIATGTSGRIPDRQLYRLDQFYISGE
jgi:hypothetical protein